MSDKKSSIPPASLFNPLEAPEPHALGLKIPRSRTAYDVKIEDDDDEDEGVVSPPVPQSVSPARIQRPKPRPAPHAPAPETLDAVQVIASPTKSEPRTVGEPPPALVTVRKARVVENPTIPEAKNNVKVIVESFGRATKEERRWVACGDSGVRIVTEGGGGKPREVICHIAALILDYSVSLSGAREVLVRIRWAGLPEDREGKWGNKLVRNNKERLNQLIAALEFFLGFPKLRKGVAVQLIGLPLTDPKKATKRQRHGIYFSGVEGSPAVMVRVNAVVADAEFEDALAFYSGWGLFWPPNHFTTTWPFISSSAWDKYCLGRNVAKGEMEEFGGDGLSQEERVGLLGRTAEMALAPVASLCRVAWDGDIDVELAMAWEGQLPVAPTMLGTVWEMGDVE